MQDDHPRPNVLSPADREVMEDLLDQWESACEAGHTVTLANLCADHPHLEPAVRQRVDALQAMDRRLGDEAPAPPACETLRLTTEIESLQFVAKGGLGSVYVGQDSRVHRRVAIKFMHDHLAANVLYRQRFALESEVTGRLEHPGVIPLYGIGQTNSGAPFYAMRFIDGVSMDKAIHGYFHPSLNADVDPAQIEQQRALEFRRILTSFVSVCKTIAYAHNRGIVHRDIKPANIMLGRYGETIVVDWGLASTVQRDARFKQSGEKTLLPSSNDTSGSSGHGGGTPAYMSPEQASELAPTPASDIYSLGATLFKVICGKPPVEGVSLEDVKQKIIQGRLVDAIKIQPSADRSLVAICRKAMALQPSQRYETALDLADDVERFLADEPVSAFHEPVTAKLARLARHHRLAAQAALLGLLSCLIIAGVATVWLSAYASRERTARHDAQELQQVAESTRRDNLGMSARFLAKSIAQEIDLRWRVLETEASSSVLRNLVAEYNREHQPGSKPTAESLNQAQQWLDKRFIAHSSAVKTASWFVNSLDGTQLARSPAGESIGKNFAHRDYFSGLGKDFEPLREAAAAPIPLENRIVYMSAAFESTNTRTLMVAFSVPIWNDGPENYQRQRIGILCMTVELGDFALGQNSWLVDTRETSFDQQTGLVLHHPRIKQLDKSHALPSVSRAFLDSAKQLRESATQSSSIANGQTVSSVSPVLDPVDQVTKLVAFAPIVIMGRPANIADSGWIVVVTEASR